ncbi:peptidoglycan D,D-transpeptidase FtsI family protein [Pinisolibacter aquiterrae]|uniref:peptidoglycan D,D-transpeptidase FtsI family protein n=1 Tax=Pinisolibacter aquiterrae TaxID=2815579 RepID=UPI001E41FE3A|nr:penicillin-binding protein 2 [Pinisolibacter aquiterrae]MCC8237646.1 penicillin-binding protein 2 [Pinisolibacter aquiterrae]
MSEPSSPLAPESAERVEAAAATPTEAAVDHEAQESASTRHMKASRKRIVLAGLGFAVIYAAVAMRLVSLGGASDEHSEALASGRTQVSTARPDILDRNGEVLATDIKSSSLYAEPRRILDVEEAIDALGSVIPEMRADEAIRKKLSSKAGFVWLRRELTVEQKRKIFRLGLPGIGFMEENRRIYPGGALAGHVIGTVDVDNRGILGMERAIDRDMGLDALHAAGFAGEREMKPKRLSLDIRVQHVVRDEMVEAVQKFHAIAGVGIVLDARTMEVLAMVSLPDFDPNDRNEAFKKDHINRATLGVYEMGSVFKTFNSAFTLDSGKVTLNDVYDTTPLVFGSQRINDFHSKGRALTVPEIFLYSSNNGSARMALKAGSEAQRAFFERVAFHRRLETELPDLGLPLFPKRLSDVSTATMSFGHGLSVTPMHTAVAGAAVVNGGLFLDPTFYPRTRAEAEAEAKRVLKPETSDKMRYLFRLNATPGTGGSGSKADVPGYRVGGKTGTAEKIENGRYSANKRFNSFLSAFPMDDPKYVVLTVLDDPKAESGGDGPATAGLNAGATAGAIIRRIAPLLGVMPKYDLPKGTVASN